MAVMYVQEEPSRNRRQPTTAEQRTQRLRSAVESLVRMLQKNEDRLVTQFLERHEGQIVAELERIADKDPATRDSLTGDMRKMFVEYLRQEVGKSIRTGEVSGFLTSYRDQMQLEEPVVAETMLKALQERDAAVTLRCALSDTDDTPRRARALADVLAAAGTVLANYRRTRRLGRLDPVELRRTLAGLTSAPTSVRLDAARSYGYALADARGPAHGYEGLALAVELLPRAAWWGETWQNRERVLTEHSGLAADAAACAIAAGAPERSLELLEGGRAVLWRQLLTTRTDRQELRRAAPRLARKMDRVAAALERDLALPSERRKALVRRWLRLEADKAELERRWAVLAAQARDAVPDGGFTIPAFGADLSPAAAEGPVVVVNVSRWRSDAVIVASDGDPPVVVNLPELPQDQVRLRARRYIHQTNDTDRDRKDRNVAEVLSWLWSAVAGPIMAGLDERGLLEPRDRKPPRIWWCVTGVLATLPLHASGTGPVDGSGTGTAVADKAVSSYTPALLALARARDGRDSSARRSGLRDLLHVIVGEAAGHPALPSAARMRSLIERLADADHRTTLDGEDASHQAVRAALPRCRAVHFDCHGINDLAEPTNSGLVLKDRTLTIADLVGLRDEQPEFAFLAACNTSFSGNRIPDESVTLSSALLYVGCREVIGTLSPVSDSATIQISRSLYAELLHAGQVQTMSSARALHRATLQLRILAPGRPSSWVPFVHVGI